MGQKFRLDLKNTLWGNSDILSNLSSTQGQKTNNCIQGRAVCLRNKNKEKLLSQLAIDTDRNQIEFKPNKYLEAQLNLISFTKEFCRFKSSKYTLLTFLPLNLLEQFRRIANFYFLVTLILTMVIDSPISPESWLLSLMLVVAIAMVKQGYEDYLRFNAYFIAFFCTKHYHVLYHIALMVILASD